MSAKVKKTDLEVLLDAALLKRGLRLPRNESELAALEAELGKVEVPARLLVPPDFGSAAMKFRLVPHHAPGSEEGSASEEMARAARGGGVIDKEVEAQMARDRAAAEKVRTDEEE